MKFPKNEIGYTETLNMFLSRGIIDLYGGTEEQKTIASGHMLSGCMEEASHMDMMIDKMVKEELPKVIMDKLMKK